MIVVSDSWKKLYPGAYAGFLAMEDVINPPHHAELERRKEALQEELRTRHSGQTRADIEALPVMRAYDAYYKRFKKTYHVQLQLESLVFKGKPIPTVAALVEAQFMAELKNLLLTAGHDLDILDLPVTLSVADGTERFTLLRGEEQILKPGDMMMFDRQGIITSVIYGLDKRTQITADTRRALFTVYAPPGIEAEAVQDHLEDIRANVLLVAPQAKTILLNVVGTD
jgi:DNA/RNA-binding domain of Phe-tRNA-synthetase-like protein